MKRIFTLFFCILILVASYSTSRAQSFNLRDTIYYTWSGRATVNFLDTLHITAADSIIIAWKVIRTDFPADWQALSGMCDNNTCYAFSSIWPSGILIDSKKYAPGLADFHVQTNLSTGADGTHYITARLNNNAAPNDSATATWIISKNSTGVTTIAKSSDEVALYPNPVHDELNIVYDASADVKTIAVYNIIGKVLVVYKVTNSSSANLDLENIPSGLYFVRLMNSHGGVVTTRKFTKQ